MRSPGLAVLPAAATTADGLADVFGVGLATAADVFGVGLATAGLAEGAEPGREVAGGAFLLTGVGAAEPGLEGARAGAGGAALDGLTTPPAEPTLPKGRALFGGGSSEGLSEAARLIAVPFEDEEPMGFLPDAMPLGVEASRGYMDGPVEDAEPAPLGEEVRPLGAPLGAGARRGGGRLLSGLPGSPGGVRGAGIREFGAVEAVPGAREEL